MNSEILLRLDRPDTEPLDEASANPQPQDKYVVRLPDGMRDAIKNAATANNRTMNAEIIAALQAHLGETKTIPSQLDRIIEILERSHGKPG